MRWDAPAENVAAASRSGKSARFPNDKNNSAGYGLISMVQFIHAEKARLIMLRKSLVGIVTMGVMFVAGCANFQKGQTVVKWEDGGPVRIGTAPGSAQYALFSGTDLRNPQITYMLKGGDRLGFVEKNGQVYAVAGDHEDVVQPTKMTKTFLWRKIGAYQK
jgi:hypothetical protein